MTNFYNNTYDLFNGLNRPAATIPIISIGSVGFLVYSVELLLISTWFIVHQGDRLFCCYPRWHLASRGKAVGKSMTTTHLLMLVCIIGCIYKLASTAVMVGEQVTKTIGPEFICFVFIDLCWYDVCFGTLLLILLRVLMIQWTYGRNDTDRSKLIAKVLKIVIIASASISMTNALFTTLALVLSPTSDILGPMLYAVTFPVLATVKVLFMVMAAVFGSILIWINKNSVDSQSTLQPPKEIELEEVKTTPERRDDIRRDEEVKTTPERRDDIRRDEETNGEVSERKREEARKVASRRRWSETLKKNRALGLRVGIMILIVVISHIGLICMIPVIYFAGTIPLIIVYLLPGSLLNLLLLILFFPERAKWGSLMAVLRT